jgi:hypothetical protein
VSKIHLTDIVVQRLKTPGTYFDATTPGFGIRVGKHRKVCAREMTDVNRSSMMCI